MDVLHSLLLPYLTRAAASWPALEPAPPPDEAPEPPHDKP